MYAIAQRNGFVTSEFDPVAFELGFRELDADNDGYVTLNDIIEVTRKKFRERPEAPKWFQAYQAATRK